MISENCIALKNRGEGDNKKENGKLDLTKKIIRAEKNSIP